MAENEKTWVIGITDDLVTKKPTAEPPAATRPPFRSPARATVSRPTVRVQPKPPVKAQAHRRMHFALVLALTYLLGPFALLLTSGGRQARGWLVAGLGSGLAGIGMVVWRGRILSAVDVGWALVLLAAAVSLVSLLWFSAWARALTMTWEPDAAIRRERSERLPQWLKRPLTSGALGFLVPGLGLLLAGRVRRAAIVLWLGQLPVLAGVALMLSPWAWNVNRNSALGAIDPSLLESLFLVAAAALVLAIIGWIAQALEGGRQALRIRGVMPAGRGDRYALALVASLVIVAVVYDPAPLAQSLDEHAGQLRESGLKVIPLAFTLAAHRCDPAQSRYAIQAMGLYEELGRFDRAEALRADLDRNLVPFVNLVLRERPMRDAEHEFIYVRSEPVKGAAAVPEVVDATLQGTPMESPPEPTGANPGLEAISPAALFGTMMVPDPK